MSKFQISSSGAYVNPQLTNIIDELPIEGDGREMVRRFSLWGRLFSTDRRASVISNTSSVEVIPKIEFYRSNGTVSRKSKRPDIEDLHSPHSLISQVWSLIMNENNFKTFLTINLLSFDKLA